MPGNTFIARCIEIVPRYSAEFQVGQTYPVETANHGGDNLQYYVGEKGQRLRTFNPSEFKQHFEQIEVSQSA
ncbi:MAG: hypothetical protein V1668_02330 [Patescibacteria group bacterium]